MSFTVLIPARLASTRLPGKPLADIGGAPMVVRVAQRAGLAGASRVVVACDSASIQAACTAHGIESVLTHAHHPSGSDRLAQACDILALPDQAIVVNVQGDEPLIEPALIAHVAALLATPAPADMGTAAQYISSKHDQHDPNIVKVVTNARGQALYFSRSPIPFNRDGDPRAPQLLRHIGIYSYRASFLRQFPKLPQSPLEISESLEQLRALWHGYSVAVHIHDGALAAGVDTAQDLQRARALWAALPPPTPPQTLKQHRRCA